MKDHVNAKYKKFDRMKSYIKAKHLVSMTIAVVKYGTHWDVLAQLFGLKSTSLKPRVIGIVLIPSDHIDDRVIVNYEKEFKIDE